MLHLTNPKPVYDDTHPTDQRLWRNYRRLLAIPSGVYSNRVLRDAFRINGQFERERLQEFLMELEKHGCLTASWGMDGTRMHYRLTLNPPEEIDGVNALNSVDTLAPGTKLMNDFMDAQARVLTKKKSPTIKDRALAKRLLKDVDLPDALALVKAYWGQRADRRVDNNFGEFYYQYPRLLNDIVDDRQTEEVQAARERQRNAPKPSRREWLIRQIAIANKKGRPLFGMDKELAELDAEE